MLDAELQERIGAPLRTLLWERASLSAVVAGLAVDAAMAEARLGIGISDQDGDSWAECGASSRSEFGLIVRVIDDTSRSTRRQLRVRPFCRRQRSDS